MKVGQILYACYSDDTTGKVSFEEYHVRTIRKGKIYATLKGSFTWGKRSSKHGDFGWLDPVPAWCRQRVDLCSWLFTTKLQAIRNEIKRHHPEDFVSPEIAEKALKTLKSLETKNKRAK
ncbi:hypothetical protein Milano_108 [Agrobacterium phage Milano]|nr:hypothetical protein Milano_108 [Agrobacterium phage Milano]